VAKKRTIKGPGAADFLAAPGGIDFPETDPSKGTAQLRERGLVDDPADLEPQLDPPDEVLERERTIDLSTTDHSRTKDTKS
jgi:hypothetical protein